MTTQQTMRFAQQRVGYGGSLQVQQITTLPVISTSQNGSGTANTIQTQYDQYGNVVDTIDPRGVEADFGYDVVTGSLVQRVDDIGAERLNLETDSTVDLQGRPTEILGPTHTIDLGGTATAVRRATWFYYDDANFTTYRAQGFATGPGPGYSFTLENPVWITIRGPDGRINARVRAAAATTSGTLADIINAAGGGPATFPQSSEVSRVTFQYSDCCLLISRRDYFLIPASGDGTSGVNYSEASFGFDSMKRRNRTVTPGGTITDLVFDVRNQVVKTYVGTNDTGATEQDPTGGGASGNNMVLVTANTFDANEKRGQVHMLDDKSCRDRSN